MGAGRTYVSGIPPRPPDVSFDDPAEAAQAMAQDLAGAEAEGHAGRANAKIRHITRNPSHGMGRHLAAMPTRYRIRAEDWMDYLPRLRQGESSDDGHRNYNMLAESARLHCAAVSCD